MTEADWLACDHAAPMLIYLRGEVSEQERAESKASLHSGAGVLYPGPSPFFPPVRFTRFIAACLGRLRLSPLEEPTIRYLDAFQRYADGNSTLDEVQECCSAMHAAGVPGQRRAEDYLAFWGGGTPFAARSACRGTSGAFAWAVAKDSIAMTCAEATEDDWFEWGFSGGPPDPLFQATRRAEDREQVRLLREVLGNPFRPITFDASWRTPTVVMLAEAADDSCLLPCDELEQDRLAVLADALEDAGCSNTDVLSHLRGPGPHSPGCWALDLCLGMT
jgi:hypothetical protein